MESKNEILDAATLHVRAVSAAVRYLEGKGCTVVERDFITEIGSFDIIATDDTEESALVFISVNETYDEDFAESLPNRETCEHLAAKWFASDPERTSPYLDHKVRFDDISMIVQGPKSAFLKHHMNALGNIDDENRLKIKELEKQLKKSKEQIARILAALSDDARADLQAQGII